MKEVKKTSLISFTLNYKETKRPNENVETEEGKMDIAYHVLLAKVKGDP